ncbi:DNA polymerase IV [Candidatus Bathyarchaeota archaeon]|nr:DNA polymerase IV [Candidatus Bathyarchaeota archaeon]
MAKRKIAEDDGVFPPVDRMFYEEVSTNIMSILRQYADSFEQVGIDEAYLDVTKKVNGSFEEAGRLAQRIVDEVKFREKITVSIGVAPNKLVAKIAADFRKPTGLTVVTPQQTQSFLAPLPVDRLLGVGKKTSEKMETLGIRTLGDLSRFDVQKLVASFGKTLGTYFHYDALGVDDSPVSEKGKAQPVSRISTLKEDTRDISVVMSSVEALCENIFTNLKQRGLEFKTVSVIVVLKDMSLHSRSRTFESPILHLDFFMKTV